MSGLARSEVLVQIFILRAAQKPDVGSVHALLLGKVPSDNNAGPYRGAEESGLPLQKAARSASPVRAKLHRQFAPALLP